MPQPNTLRRSWLNVPAHRATNVERLATYPADVIVFDLEDGVASSHKKIARETLIKSYHSFKLLKNKEIFIRSNGLRTDDFEQDLNTILGLAPELTGMIVPKVEDEIDIQKAHRALAKTALEIVPIIESLAAEAAIEKILGASKRIRTVSCGEYADYSVDFGAYPKVLDAMQAGAGHDLMCRVIKAAKRHGCEILDGPWIRLKDPVALVARTQWARRMGFSGKVAIHPTQLAIINELLTPSRTELDRAQEIVTHYETHQGSSGAVPFQGRFIIPPEYRAAKAFLKKYQKLL